MIDAKSQSKHVKPDSPESLKEYSLVSDLCNKTRTSWLNEIMVERKNKTGNEFVHFVWPVNDIEGVKVSDSTGYLCSIEPGSGLREAPLSLQVEEQL